MTRILIVDDKEENLYLLQALLSGHGHAVEPARHGAEALVKARQSPPDLIISDLLMPVMDGYTLLRHWKADDRLKRVPFIVYTATYTAPEDERLALSLGADAFILKPAEPEEFITRIGEVLNRTAAPSPQPPNKPMGEEKELLKVYSETLIRKLEQKTLELQEMNHALEQDIAGRKASEAALRESEAEFRQLVEAMPQIIWITRPDGWHTHFNRRWMDFTGRTLEESLGHGWNPAFHPEDRPRAAALWEQATTTGEPYEIEYRLRRADGTYHWMLGRALPIRDTTGKIVKWFGTCTDIDELKRAQERISEQAALLDKAQDAIILRDLEGRVLYWNQSAERLYGWTPEEVAGRDLTDFLYDDPAPWLAAQAAAREQGEWTGITGQKTKTGRRLIIECRLTLVRDDQGQPRSILAINTDVTARQKMEQQSLRAQRMESIGTLAGGIAHDLNNVLAPILISVEVLQEEVRSEDGQAMLATVQSCAQRGADLVRQVLTFARGVEGERMEVNLSHLLRDIRQVIGETFPKNITADFEPARESWTVIGDPTQLHQVLMNLCVNARDAMPRGGTLRVTTANCALDDVYAGMHVDSKPGSYVVVEVADNGTGIPPEAKERIFEPFFTTKEFGKGTGLGLSTTLAIVRSHGGFINVYSEPGNGTRFKIYLPARAGSRSDQPAGAAPREALRRGNGELVLVVDDEEGIREMTRKTLTRFGYQVLLAAHGAEAVVLYAQQRERIAVVLTDMAMPVMDGPATIIALRAMNPAVKIIGSSGLDTHAGLTDSGQPGVAHFIPKPYTAEVLLATLAKVLHK
jgi:PAS domain S-box-containing protein